MRLSVVICTIPDRLIYLSSLLTNLLKQSYVPDEVIIVTDKGQRDLILNSFPTLQSLIRIRVTETDGKGLSKARNKGISLSTGDIILFIDDDIVIPDTNILFRVKEAFEEDDQLGVYGVQVKPLFYNSVKLDDKFNWIYGCTNGKAIRPVGAFFAVRRECFNVVGLFNESLGRYGKYLLSGEETEFFNRVQRYMKLKVRLDNNMKVEHIVSGVKWRYIIRRAFMEGISKSKFKNYNLTTERRYLLMYITDPVGWLISLVTVIGYIYGKVRS